MVGVMTVEVIAGALLASHALNPLDETLTNGGFVNWVSALPL
jgi:hypothetical protein